MAGEGIGEDVSFAAVSTGVDDMDGAVLVESIRYVEMGWGVSGVWPQAVRNKVVINSLAFVRFISYITNCIYLKGHTSAGS